ncbi:uncharacterized protein ACRADG_002264 [Cochliomyia hominivorax]
MSIKFDPPKSLYHKHEFNVCTEAMSFDPLFLENINDVANSMVEIMTTCGIPLCKAKLAKPVVISSLKFYDIKRHRFSAVEQDGLCKNYITNIFKCECLMTSIEALVSYMITKRAIKAFFHGTLDYSIRNPITEAVILKEQEFIWQHAANRTIHLFEPFEHAFYNANSNYEKKINEIYKRLYERLKQRADPVVIVVDHPKGCIKKVIEGTKSPEKMNKEKPICVEKCRGSEILRTYVNSLPAKVFPLKDRLQLPPKKDKKPKNIDLNLERCYQCNCPQLICDCNIEPETGKLVIDCSQGPFNCQWFRVDKQNKPDPCIENRELHQCPVDCATSDSSSESDESQYCECADEEVWSENEKVADGEAEEFENNDNEQHLDKFVVKDLPKRGNRGQCQIRAISKLPVMKI